MSVAGGTATHAEGRPTALALWRGLRTRCPACGTGRIFGRYLKVNDHCRHCGEALHHHRADDAPPYATIFVVGHVVGALMLATEMWNDTLALWIHMTLWPVLAILLCLWLLPCLKGALIGLQWAQRMHGFSGAPDEPA